MRESRAPLRRLTCEHASFSQEVKFAYRLFDLDGSGALDKSEAVTVLRDAMRSDLSQYGQRGALPKVDMWQKDSIRALVDEISNRTGTDEIGISEFEVRALSQVLPRSALRDCMLAAQMMCSRMPRIYQPAKYLFLLMNKTSKEAYRAVSTMSPDGLKVRSTARLAYYCCSGRGNAGADAVNRTGTEQGRAAGL